MNNVDATSQPYEIPSRCGSPASFGGTIEALRAARVEKSHAFKTLLCAVLCPFASEGCDVSAPREYNAVHVKNSQDVLVDCPALRSTQ